MSQLNAANARASFENTNLLFWTVKVKYEAHFLHYYKKNNFLKDPEMLFLVIFAKKILQLCSNYGIEGLKLEIVGVFCTLVPVVKSYLIRKIGIKNLDEFIRIFRIADF